MTGYQRIASFFFSNTHFVHNSLNINDLGDRAAPRRKSLTVNDLLT